MCVWLTGAVGWSGLVWKLQEVGGSVRLCSGVANVTPPRPRSEESSSTTGQFQPVSVPTCKKQFASSRSFRHFSPAREKGVGASCRHTALMLCNAVCVDVDADAVAVCL